MIAEVNGVKINYELTGQGPTVVFIHGICMGLRQWDEQVKYFRDSYQCLTLDLRGHKLSSPGKITVSNFAADILALLDFLDIAQAHFVGYSLGGTVAQEILRQQSSRVLSIVLSSTTSFTKVPKWRLMLSQKFGPLRKQSMETLGPIMASYCCPPEFPRKNPQAYQDFVQMLQEHDKGIYQETVIATSNLDYRDVLKEANVPVLIIVGELDQVLPPKNSQLIKDIVPSSQLLIFPGTGHLLPYERANEYNKALTEFLTDIS